MACIFHDLFERGTWQGFLDGTVLITATSLFSPWYSLYAWLVIDTSLRGLSIVDFAAPLLQERYAGKPCSL
jgi:hypothetical protein